MGRQIIRLVAKLQRQDLLSHFNACVIFTVTSREMIDQRGGRNLGFNNGNYTEASEINNEMDITERSNLYIILYITFAA